MVTLTRGETAKIAGGNLRPVDNDAMLYLWQSKKIHTLTNAQRNRIAGAALDEAARAIVAYLDRETSLKWEQLDEITNTNWPDTARAVALLVWADLCQPGPKRLRLTETGISILDEAIGASVD